MTQAEEYFNALSTNIQLSGTNIKVVAISSVQPNEGKSTILRIWRQPLRVRAIVPCWSMRISVTRSWQVSSRAKVVLLVWQKYFLGRVRFRKQLRRQIIQNWDVLLAGQVSPNPTGLLQSKNFEVIIEALRNHYDYIVVDTPPIGMVIDAAIIAQRCDGSLIVTAAGAVSRKAVQKAKEQLEQTGTPFLGVVLNKFDIQLEKYGSYGNYGNYGNYGKKDKE